MKWLGAAADARASTGGVHEIYLQMRMQSWSNTRLCAAAVARQGAAQQDPGQEPRMQSTAGSWHWVDVSSLPGGSTAPPHQPHSARSATRGTPPTAPATAVQQRRQRQRLAGCCLKGVRSDWRRRAGAVPPLGGRPAAAPRCLPCWRLRCCRRASSHRGCRVRCHRHRARALLSWRHLRIRHPCTPQQPARLPLPAAPNSHHERQLAAALRRAPAQRQG